MSFDLGQHTILLGVTGSHAYGMARRDSDIDLRGIYVTPISTRLNPFALGFDQYVKAKGRPELGVLWHIVDDTLRAHPSAKYYYEATQGEDLDTQIYDLAKYIKLAAGANPNVLELLFLDDQDILHTTASGNILRERRDLFLTTKAKHTYSGYARAQLKRIKGHRAWLLNPPRKEPTREDFGLPKSTVLGADDRSRLDEVINKIIRDWGVEDGLDEYIEGAAQDVLRERMHEFQATLLRCSEALLDDRKYELATASVGLTKDVLYALKQERAYRSARRQWESYQGWLRERNPARAELEAKFGFDTKHASHLIRILRTGLEILQGEGLKVRRDDAEELLAIRNGAYSYDELIEEADRLEAEIGKAYKVSKLPKSPDTEAIAALFRSLLALSTGGVFSVFPQEWSA